MAAGEIEDPLGPNTTLIYWDKISMVFHAEDNKFTRKTYDVDANMVAPTVKERVGSLSVNGGGNMSVAAGYFGGAEGWMDTVAAWEYPAGKISIYVESYNSSLAKSVDATVNSADVVQGANSGWPTVRREDPRRHRGFRRRRLRRVRGGVGRRQCVAQPARLGRQSHHLRANGQGHDRRRDARGLQVPGCSDRRLQCRRQG